MIAKATSRPIKTRKSTLLSLFHKENKLKSQDTNQYDVCITLFPCSCASRFTNAKCPDTKSGTFFPHLKMRVQLMNFPLSEIV